MSDNKVLGLEPTKYVKIAYILLLASSAIGVLATLLALAGMYTGINALANLAGLIGLLMAVIGWAAFKDKFASLEINHMQYIVILFLVFLVVGIIVGAIFMMNLSVILAISLILGLIQLLLVFTGFNSWQHGRMITKDNIKGEVQLATKRA